MKIQLLFFGITSDITGKREDSIAINEKTSVKNLKSLLIEKYPKLKNYASFSIAVNTEYANDTVIIKNNDIIALIPPVSGG